MLSLLLSLAPLLPQEPDWSDAVRELHVSGPPGTRVEYFQLDWPAEGRRQDIPVGVARWVSGPADDSGAGWRTELEIHYFEEATRVHLVENLAKSERELVFRELRERSGRTLRFLWTPDQIGFSTETTGGEIRRREYDLPRGVVLPLSLVEVVRKGGTVQDDTRVFQPLTGELEELSTRVEVRGGRRTLELERAGLLVGRFEFEDDRLASFSWQSGGPEATPVSAEEHARLVVAGRRGVPETDGAE